ncbi:tyrosine-type recombinase/integrase [Paenibacillus senegalensis]|uniref:tyrosine-type recombinase/integrase n=1 Tax=Paenibacillus senegalensis TaxID=1465766 RepID=UPI000289EF21|nr:tyrosine-type recombinase/integrase [Paenibacillus senegalensis]
MAYIRKRGKTWYYTVDIDRDPVTGQRNQVTKGGFRTKKEAEAAAARVELEVADGVYVKVCNKSFAEFSKEWLEYYESVGNVKPGSVRVRKTRVNKLLTYFSAIKLTGITRAAYQSMLIDLKNKGLANETIVSIHATAKMIFRRAVELNLLKINPTDYSKVPRHQRTVEDIENFNDIPKYLEKEDLAKFLETAKVEGRDFDYPIFMVLAYTGLRVGELIALKWTDVDMENMTISITKTYDNVRNNTREYNLVPPKTEAGIRLIEFDEVIKKLLEDHRRHLNITKMKYRLKFYDKGFIFPNIGSRYPGYPLVQKTIEKRMERLLGLSKLNPTLTPHSLRHTHTTLLAEAGATLQEIMERLGHKDDKTTRLVYLHVTKTMKRGAAQKFSRLMKNVVKM